MSSKTRATITWCYILAFAAISGLGEGLHFLPGCGHAVPAGHTDVWMGAVSPGMTLGASDGVTRVERPLRDRSLGPATDQCPICQHFSFASSVVTAVAFVAVAAVAQAVAALDCPQPLSATAGSFQARAPPQV
jgi:hypothetical protein